MSAPELKNRGPELVVAALLLGLGLLVVTDSIRVGTGWADDGPRAGYFPFYIGCLLSASSAYVLVRQLLKWGQDSGQFAEHAQLRLVVAMLVPMLVYVALIYPLGIYVPSAILIAYFMLRYGKYKWFITLPVAAGVPIIFFLVFERWFLVTLPKGPVEQLLGL